MVVAKARIRRDVICCPECLKKRKIKRFSRVMDLNQHLAKKHNSEYKAMPPKKLDGHFVYSPRTKLEIDLQI